MRIGLGAMTAGDPKGSSLQGSKLAVGRALIRCVLCVCVLCYHPAALPFSDSHSHSRNHRALSAPSQTWTSECLVLAVPGRVPSHRSSWGPSSTYGILPGNDHDHGGYLTLPMLISLSSA